MPIRYFLPGVTCAGSAHSIDQGYGPGEVEHSGPRPADPSGDGARVDFLGDTVRGATEPAGPARFGFPRPRFREVNGQATVWLGSPRSRAGVGSSIPRYGGGSDVRLQPTSRTSQTVAWPSLPNRGRGNPKRAGPAGSVAPRTVSPRKSTRAPIPEGSAGRGPECSPSPGRSPAVDPQWHYLPHVTPEGSIG